MGIAGAVPYTRADALEFIANVREKGSAIWAILNADRLVGMIGRDPQLGFWLDPRCWGAGADARGGAGGIGRIF